MNYKRFFSLVLSICLVMSLFTGFAGSAGADGDVIEHTVQNGEYLFKICSNYNLNYYQCKSAIMALNGFTTEMQLNKLSVGQKIKLPANNAVATSVSSSTTTTVTTTTTAGSTTTTTSTSTTAVTGSGVGYQAAFYVVPYIVASGDTLNSICNKLGTSYNSFSGMILAMNGLNNAGTIKAGQQLYIPVSNPPAAGSYFAVVNHVVKSGENLTAICSSYNTSYGTNTQLINGLNYGKNLNKLWVGQSVYVPVAAVGNGTAGTASTVPAGTAANAYEINMGEVIGIGYHGYPYATVNGVNVSRAAAGSTVTINGNADNGYALKSITVIRLDSQATIPTKGNTFVMPASAVKVNVNYQAGYRLYKSPTANGTFDLYVNGTIADHALAGDKITISANPNFTFDAASATATGATVTKDAVNSYSFVMPASNVTVSVVFKEAARYSITTNKTRTYSSIQYGTVEYTVGGTPADMVAEGAVVTMNFSLPQNVVVRTITVYCGTDLVPFYRVEGQPKWYFTMPAGNVTVNVEFGSPTAYSINTIPVSDSGNATGTVSYQVDGLGLTSAQPGQTVRIVVNPTGQSQLSQILIRYTDGTTNVNTYVDGSGMTCFTMPESSVNVYVHFIPGAQKYSVYNLGSVVLAFKNVSGQQTTSYQSGETCIVMPQYDKDNYHITGVYWRDSAGNDHAIAESPAGSGEYPFTMPGYNTGVYATVEYYETWAEIQLVASAGVELYMFDNSGKPMASGTHVKSGSTVTFQAIVDSGYTFGGFSKTGGVNELAAPSDLTRTYTVSAKDNYSSITVYAWANP